MIKLDKFTPIHNDVIEAMAKTNFSPYETRILLALFRKTYGWGKKTDKISLSQFSYMTGMETSHVARTIKRMKQKGILISHSKGHYGFNKKHVFTVNNVLPVRAVPTEAVPVQAVPVCAVEILPVGAIEVLPVRADTKDIITKEIIKKETDIQKVVNHFKVITGNDINDKEWDKLNYARNTSSAKKLFDYFKESEKAKLCITGVKEWAEENGLDWTLETVVKRATDWNNGKLVLKSKIIVEERKPLQFKGIVPGSDQ